MRLLHSWTWDVVGHEVGGRGEGRAERGEGTVAGEDAHHQMTPRGKIHVHLGRSEEVLPCGRQKSYTDNQQKSKK